MKGAILEGKEKRVRYAGRLVALACSTIFGVLFLIQIIGITLLYTSHFHFPLPDRHYPITTGDIVWAVASGLLFLSSVFLYLRLARSRS